MDPLIWIASGALLGAASTRIWSRLQAWRAEREAEWDPY